MLDLPLVFLDLETTGTAPTEDRIVDIGLLEIEHGRVKERWTTLVNPGGRVPSFVEALTGISAAMVADAPRFESIAPSLYRRLAGKVLVAHNARFDYAFLRNEFSRAGIAYRSKVLCTARLSRALFPEHPHHNLDSLIERHGLACEDRHRGLGDAQAMWDFVQCLYRSLPAQQIERAAKAQLQAPSLPAGLEAGALDHLPDTPGVYLFYGENRLPLYVGKSVDLRSRVWSHFSGDHRSARAMELAQQVRKVEWIGTTGELGALLTEARLIKELAPLHNRVARKPSGYHGFDWATPQRPLKLLSRDPSDTARLEHLLGVFRSRASAREALREIAARDGLCPGLLGLERKHVYGTACFAHQLKRCAGACVGLESLDRHNARLRVAMQALRLQPWPFTGPIGLREQSDQDPESRTDVHLFERWCYLGTARAEPDVYELLQEPRQARFDLDLYHILRRTLAARKRSLKLIDFGPMKGLFREPAEAVC